MSVPWWRRLFRLAKPDPQTSEMVDRLRLALGDLDKRLEAIDYLPAPQPERRQHPR